MQLANWWRHAFPQCGVASRLVTELRVTVLPDTEDCMIISSSLADPRGPIRPCPHHGFRGAVFPGCIRNVKGRWIVEIGRFSSLAIISII